MATTADCLGAGAASLSESLLLLGGAGFLTGGCGGFDTGAVFTGVDGAAFCFFFASSSDESESDELSFFLLAARLAGGGMATFGITTTDSSSSNDGSEISLPLETAGLALLPASLSESLLLDETAFFAVGVADFAAGVTDLAGVATGFFLVSSSDESESDELSFFAAGAFVTGVGFATAFVAGVMFTR